MQGINTSASYTSYTVIKQHQDEVMRILIDAVFLTILTVVAPAYATYHITRAAGLSIAVPHEVICLVGLAICIAGAITICPTRQTMFKIVSRISVTGAALGVIIALL